MKRSQVLLLTVAVVAGGLAGFLVLRGGSRPAPVVQQVAEAPVAAKTRVLVAAQDIGAGERLTSSKVEWLDWPESAVRPDYITITTTPDAPQAMNGSVARYAILQGEPVREAKLVRSGQGYLAAILTPGMRAVSISITPVSGSGGFITPSDHVDVVSTHASSGGQISETVLANVKVLAIGKQLGETGAGSGASGGDEAGSEKGFNASTIATLELDPGQAETLLSAANSGSLSLVLRSVTDFADTGDASQRRNQVNVIRYGRQVSVMAGSGSGDGVSVDPANYAPPPPPASSPEPQTPTVELQ